MTSGASKQSTATHVNQVEPSSVTYSETRCQTWELEFESPDSDGFQPAAVSIELRITDNRFGKPQYVDLSVVSERERPQFSGGGRLATPDEFVDYVQTIDLRPVEGVNDGYWSTEDFIDLWESGQLDTEAGISSWVWRALLAHEDIRDELLRAASFCLGSLDIVPEHLFGLTPKRRGHLRLV